MNTLETLKSILAEKVDVSKIKEEDNLQSLGLDSLDLAEIMISIEDALGIEFTTNEILKLKTIKDVLNLIETKKK
ncbi:MAG: acyl carrier protein [Bacilli bacterium]|nr:acyl carrier protein [Bacilli bacterium]